MLRKRNQKILWILFGVYCLTMLWLLFGRSGAAPGVSYWEQVASSINLRPFHTVRLYLHVLRSPHHRHLIPHAIFNLAGNLILFIPLGLFLPLCLQKLRSLFKTLLTTGAIVVSVELLQLFTLLGSCDIDDLILNLCGASFGYLLFRLFPGLSQQHK